jgi:hypothetical protein
VPKRVITAAVGVAGLVVIGLGVASATVWRADDVLVATTPASGHLVVTDPGVLELGGDPVTIRATTTGGDPVVLAIGRDTDVAGWVGSDAHVQVTGLSSWTELEVNDVPAGAEPTASAAPSPSSSSSTKPSASASASATKKPSASATATPTGGTTPAEGEDGASEQPDPTDSDLWVAQATGDGSARLVWPAQDGRWSLLVAGTGDSAPTLSLAWPRVVTTPWLWPLVILGSLMALAAAALLARDWNRRRTGNVEPEWHSVNTGTMAVVGEGAPALTRRQIREAELARAARPRTGAVPQVATPAAGTPSAPQSAGAQPNAAAAPPTTRRALRTGAIPTVAARPTPEPVDPAAQRPLVPTGEAPSSSVPGGGPDGGDDHPTVTVALPPDPAHADAPKPAWLRGRGAAGIKETAGAAETAGTRAAPQAGLASSAPDAPTAVVPAVPHAAPTAPGGWLPTAPVATDAAQPRSASRPNWLPVSAHPATSDGGAPDGAPSEAEASTPEPATPPADAQAGSRADAWRRAWGLPPTDEPGRDESGEER